MASSRDTIEETAAKIFALLRRASASPTDSQQTCRALGMMNESSAALPTYDADDDDDDVLARAFSMPRLKPEVVPSVAKVYSPRYYQLQRERQNLPVWKHKHAFLSLLKENKVILVHGETGCGKTSQIPQWCMEYENAKQAVVCTQPRRMAASSIAKRVAAEMDVKVGNEVGYHIRFDNRTSAKTILTFMTEGVLVRQIASNPMLNGYGVILLDECHERGIFADVLMGLLQTLVCSRDDLRLVIMSASLNKGRFQNYFENAPILEIRQRLHPIKIIFEQKDLPDSVQAAVAKVRQIHMNETRGDILIFMIGKGEVEQTCALLKAWVSQPNYSLGELRILPLHGMLPSEEQDLVFEPAPPDTAQGISRKVVVATNLAETSVTIDGIVFVIDCGYMNQKIYNGDTKVEHIVKKRITKTNAAQRAGRAGRTSPGKCYRLYTAKTYLEMEPYIQPEITRSNLSSIVLDMKDMGIENVTTFNFMDPPEMDALMNALQELIQLQALDKEFDITRLGKHMAEFPVDPMVAKALISSCEYGCPEEMLTIAAMLSVEVCFIWNPERRIQIKRARQQFISPKGDHIMLLKLYKAFRANGECKDWCHRNFVHYRHLQEAVGIRSQLKAILQKLDLYQTTSEIDDPEYVNVRKALLSGFGLQVALKWGSGYRTMHDQHTEVKLHASTGLIERPEFVIYHERFTTKSAYICIATPIERLWYKKVTGLSLTELKLPNANCAIRNVL